MAFDRLNGRLLHLASEWNKAEKVMKLAERVRAEAIQASVNELRYAGRRIVDVILWKPDETGLEPDLDTCCSEALQFCYRAQHDAVDAAILFVHKALNEYEAKFGLELLMRHFPQVAEIRAKIFEIDDIIVGSREDRLKRRTSYNGIISDHLPSIVNGYRLIHGNREALEKLSAEAVAARALEERRQAERDEKDKTRFIATNWVAIVTGLGGAVLGVLLGNFF